jgi:hypothetical protein
MAVTKETILGTKPPHEEVDWLDGEKVIVAAMGGTDRDAFELENVLLGEASEHDYGHLANFRARLLVRCIRNDDGARMFADVDAHALGAVWCEPLDRAFDVAKRLNGYSQKDIEALEKNS